MAKKKPGLCTTVEDDGPDGSNNTALARRAVRRRRGSLQSFPSMPLDIFHEVCGHLNPMDLLNLARTNKDYRRILMNSNSASVWKAARQHIEGLPECPPFLSEPAFANLAFDHHCHSCLKPNVKTVCWPLRARYCNQCKKINTIPDFKIDIPDVRVAYMRNPPISLIFDSALSARVARVSDVEAFRERWLSTPATIRDELLKELGMQTQRVETYCYKLEDWVVAQKAAHLKELEKIKQERLAAIVGKLNGLGWEKEVEYLERIGCSDLTHFSGVRQAKPLTERTWLTMRPALEEKMAEVRVDRLRQQRLDVLRARFPLLKHLVALFRMDTHGGFCPATRDLASCPEIRAIIESSFDDDITEESFDLIRPKMLDIVTHWKHDAMLVLEKAVRKEFPIPGDVDFTSLALCLVFKCAGCAINLLYLDLLHHPCLKRIHRNQANFLEEEPENMDDYDVAANDMIRYHPWCSSLVLVGNSNKVLRDIIIVCDQDPMRVTIDEMDKLDTRLVCKSCSTLGAVAVMTWRAAARHALEDHSSNYYGDFTWKLATEDQVSSVKSAEEESKATSVQTRESSESWYCALCPMVDPCTKPAVLEHLHNSHDISDPKDKDSIYDPYVNEPFHEPQYLKKHHFPAHLLPPGVIDRLYRDEDDDDYMYGRPLW